MSGASARRVGKGVELQWSYASPLLGSGSGRERKKAPILFEAFSAVRALVVAILAMDDFFAVRSVRRLMHPATGLRAAIASLVVR